jgi:hypothetical protein
MYMLIVLTLSRYWHHIYPKPEEAEYRGYGTMHVDVDEDARHRLNHVFHPEFSCVLYLTDFGEPTLVTDLTFSDSHRIEKGIADGELSEYWLIYPKSNKLACFSGEYLHGVAFNKGTRNITQVIPHAEQPFEAGKSRRMTLLTGWWDRDVEMEAQINVELDYPGVENLWVMQEGGRLHTMREAMASRAAMDRSGLKLAPMAFIEKTTPKISRIDQEIPAHSAIYEFEEESEHAKKSFVITPNSPVLGETYHYTVLE